MLFNIRKYLLKTLGALGIFFVIDVQETKQEITRDVSLVISCLVSCTSVKSINVALGNKGYLEE